MQQTFGATHTNCAQFILTISDAENTVFFTNRLILLCCIKSNIFGAPVAKLSFRWELEIAVFEHTRNRT